MVNKIVGSSIIGWLIYRCAVLEKLPYAINEQISSWTIKIVMIICVTQIAVLISLVRVLKKREITSIQKIIGVVIEKIYYTPLRKVGESMLKYSMIKKRIEECGQIVEVLIRRKEAIYLVIFATMFMPKWQLAISLIIDVFILNKIYLFYKWLWIIIVPLGSQGLLALIKKNIMSEKKELEEKYFDVSKEREKYKLTTKVHVEEPLLTNKTKEWIYNTNVLDIIEALSVCQKTKYFVIASILCTSLFIISWSTYLIKVLFLQIQHDPAVIAFITWVVRSIIIGI